MRRLSLVALLLLLAFSAPVHARGNDPFTYEQTGWRSSPPDVPCYEEDDGANFDGYGLVKPGFSLSQILTFCGGTDGPGGVGFWLLLRAPTDAFVVEIISPSGVNWPILIEKDRRYWITSACVGDDHGVLDGRKSGTIESGDWQINIIYHGTKTAHDVRLAVRVGMRLDNPGDPVDICVF